MSTDTLEAPAETTEASTAEEATEASPPADETTDGAPVETLLLFSPWAPEALRQRLDALALELVDDPDRLPEARGVLVATRYAPPDAVSELAGLEVPDGIPVIVLAHPAGEHTAARLMASGGTAIVAEGNEDAIRRHLEGGPPEEDVLDTYAQRLERTAAESDVTIFDRDPASNLPGPAALDERLAILTQTGQIPRYGAVRVLGSPSARLGRDADVLLRRRLGSQFRHACRAEGADIFALGPREYAVIAEHLGADDFTLLGTRLAAIAETFAPDRSSPLVLAMGHAGPESATDIATVRELAERGLAACLDGSYGDRIVGAESLTRIFSATTELEALLEAVETIEQTDPHGPGHAERVETIAAEIAGRLGIEGRRMAALRLAARLHDVGKVRLDPDERFAADADGYRRHPELGAEIVRIPAGDLVADAIRGHHERWDGSGFPDGASGVDIPLEARILAVADALDRHGSGAGCTPEAVAAIREEAGSRFDPTVTGVLDEEP
ncbi:MAG TPA: HD domain-containing protein [Actinobacteria bacterium]|nr:HD domain-containing protein [Actinomycetota bacterium]